VRDAFTAPAHPAAQAQQQQQRQDNANHIP
jgi:hypothetical protein